MEEIAKALGAANLEQIADLLYGDAAYEVVKSLSTEQRQRRQAQVGLASNVLGITAGTAAVGTEYKNYMDKRRAAGQKAPYRGKYRAPGKAAKLVPKGLKTRKGAAALGAGALGLQVANVAGDAVANRVLARSAKKQDVHKSMPDQAAVHVKGKSGKGERAKIKLVRLGTDAAFDTARTAPMVAAKAKKQVSKAATDMDIHWQGEISKMDSDKRQVFGWASIIEVNGQPVVDLQDDVMDLDTIEKAAYDYVLSSRKGGNMHARNGDEPHHVSDLVESFVLTPEKKEQMGLPDTVPTGWWVGFKVNDDETWSQVKKGERREFSIHGKGVRKALDD